MVLGSSDLTASRLSKRERHLRAKLDRENLKLYGMNFDENELDLDELRRQFRVSTRFKQSSSLKSSLDVHSQDEGGPDESHGSQKDDEN